MIEIRSEDLKDFLGHLDIEPSLGTWTIRLPGDPPYASIELHRQQLTDVRGNDLTVWSIPHEHLGFLGDVSGFHPSPLYLVKPEPHPLRCRLRHSRYGGGYSGHGQVASGASGRRLAGRFR